MILIDILVSGLDRAYDFEIDEKITTDELTKDVTKLIGEKEGVRFREGKRGLFCIRSGDLLKKDISMEELGVRNGDRLILI